MNLGTDEHRAVFTGAYLERAITEIGDHCGIAAECGPDCNGDHEPVTVLLSELHPDTVAQLETDAREFFDAHAADLAMYPGEPAYGPEQWAERGGGLFWMDRQGHGVGFGDWYVHRMLDPVRDARKRLMDACRAEGERDLYRGTDGKIHHGKSWGEIQRERNGS